MKEAEKIYISVKTFFREDGVMLPSEILWSDGRRFPVDRVLDIRQGTARKCGGQGDQYTVRIMGKIRYLFFERSPDLSGNVIGRWFVESAGMVN